MHNEERDNPGKKHKGEKTDFMDADREFSMIAIVQMTRRRERGFFR